MNAETKHYSNQLERNMIILLWLLRDGVVWYHGKGNGTSECCYLSVRLPLSLLCPFFSSKLDRVAAARA